ncbi:MAG: phosphatase PAP2 family protein [Candidatus Kariarchaeaceae archaeon]|jgi:undecaprenyl-diphosphatase
MSSRLAELDYNISFRLATLLSQESRVRKAVQIYTLSGTSFFWFLLLPVLAGIFPVLRTEFVHIWIVLLIMVPPIYAIKHTVKRDRPHFKDTRMGAVAFDEFSFPSGHASRVTFIVTLLIIYFPKFGIIWFFWGVGILISRLILGVHYITDILVGVLVTAILLVVLFYFGLLPYFSPLVDVL